MARTLSRRPTTGPRLAGALLLALALLWAQALGLVHRALHGAPLPAAATTVATVTVATDSMAHPAVGLFGHLFGGQAGDADCRVLDQLAHADALPSLPAPAVLPPLPVFALPALAHPLWLVFRAVFAARAPPALR